MAYFVTGATGFIGQFLVRNLLKRGQPIFVLVRKVSVKKLDALRVEWGATDKQIIPVVGDLGKNNLGVADADLRKLKGKVAQMLPLAAIYDLKTDASSLQTANVVRRLHACPIDAADHVNILHLVTSTAPA